MRYIELDTNRYRFLITYSSYNLIYNFAISSDTYYKIFVHMCMFMTKSYM